MNQSPPSTTWWENHPHGFVATSAQDIAQLIAQPRQTLHVVEASGLVRGLATGGTIHAAPVPQSGNVHALVASISGIYPEWLGDRTFTERHGCRFPYVVGEMAQGIATADMVVAAVRAGFMGFFGSAGLPLAKTADALQAIRTNLGDRSTAWGANLIHNLHDRSAEHAVVDLFLAHGVRRVSASAFMKLSPEVVRYAAKGLHADQSGRPRRANLVFAKVSRPEVAAQFIAPPPETLLRALVASGDITDEEATLAATLPVSEDITIEADSGGHTDNRPMTALFSAMTELRDAIAQQHGYTSRVRLGIAGGLGTPASVAAAFSMGAAYVLTGSINQAAVESGLSRTGIEMLCRADVADVAMAAAADMFEMGVKVQVLKRGSMFPTRSQRLYALYRAHASLEDIPANVRSELEKDVFGASIEAIWEKTRAYFTHTDPAEIQRAERDPKHRMALVFRWYLFMSAKWAREGDQGRASDYQIWCGPALGAFNAWVKDTFLEAPEARTVAQIGLNLLEGAAVITRAQQLRAMGVDVPAAAFRFPPRRLNAGAP